MKMNLPNKITVIRIFLAVFILIFLMFPFYQVGIKLPVLSVSGKISISFEYIISGVLFLVASVTDFLDGYLARKNNQVTDFGKVMDAIADKMLVNGVLIILAFNRDIHVLVPVIIISRDIIVDSIKMISANKSGKAVAASITGKIKTIFMMVGVTLVFFNDLPFSLFGLPLGRLLVLFATILSVYSGLEYFYNNKESFINNR